MKLIRGLLSSLVDAFLDLIGPVFWRFVSRTRWVAVEEEDGIAFYFVSNGHSTAVGHIESLDSKQRQQLSRARSGTVEFRLRSDHAIIRALRVPAAGRDYLEPIIENRLERLTPWRPEKVLYGFFTDGETDSDGQIAVEFVATSADIVAVGLARLARLDLVPTAIGLAAEPINAPLRIDLYRGQQSVGRRPRRNAILILAVVMGTILPACFASYWVVHQNEERLRSVEERLAAVRGALAEAAGEGSARTQDLALIATKRPESSVVVLIDRLAKVIPSDTFLRELEIGPNGVRLKGFSANAAALIRVLEGAGVLTDVRFAAPMTRNDEDRDSFSIVAARVTSVAQKEAIADYKQAPVPSTQDQPCLRISPRSAC